MAKKSVNNVVIRDEELTPTTLGVYSNKTKNPIGLLLLITVFILIAIFMPDIQSFVNKKLGKEEVESSGYSAGDDKGNNTGNDIDPNVVGNEKYEISSTTKIENENYELNNIALNGNNLSFTILNKQNTNLNLSSYFIELYNADGTFISRVKVSNDSIVSNNSNNYSYEVPSSVTTMAFVKKNISDYPTVTLNYDDNMEATLVCTSNKKIYNYLFVADQLKRIVHTYNLATADDANYAAIAQDYQNKSYNNNLVDGVSSSFTDTINDFYYTMNVDLEKGVDLTKLNDNNLFKFKTSPREVKFIVESQGYSCEQK